MTNKAFLAKTLQARIETRKTNRQDTSTPIAIYISFAILFYFLITAI